MLRAATLPHEGQLRVSVEGLFEENRARISDLQGHACHKGILSNHSYLEDGTFLFRRSIYSLFPTEGHLVC